MWVGEADATAREMAALQYEATLRCLAAMRPGTEMKALVDVCAEAAAGTPFQCKPIIHSRGLGADAPVVGLGRGLGDAVEAAQVLEKVLVEFQ